MMAHAASGVSATLVNSCVLSHSTPIFRSVVVGASDKSLVQLPTRVSPHAPSERGGFKILSPVLAQPLQLEFKLNAVVHVKGSVSITRGTKSKQRVWRQREIGASVQCVEVFDI